MSDELTKCDVCGCYDWEHFPNCPNSIVVQTMKEAEDGLVKESDRKDS